MQATLRFENGSLPERAFTGAVRAAILPLWLALTALVALAGLWRPIAMITGIGGAVVGCVLCPAIPVGLGLLAAFAFATFPRGGK